MLVRNKKYKSIRMELLGKEQPIKDDDSDYENEDIDNIEKKLYFGQSDSDESYFREYQNFLERGEDKELIYDVIQKINEDLDAEEERLKQEGLEMTEERLEKITTEHYQGRTISHGLVYKGRGHMNDPNSYVLLIDRVYNEDDILVHFSAPD